MKLRFQVISSGQSAEKAHAVLAVRSLDKVFHVGRQPVTVLENITFTAATGELICLLGPSGCGKSTLLTILAGFTPPSAGEVLLNDRPVSTPGPDRCVVFQEDALFPWLTVAENIAFGLKGMKRAKVAAEVDRFLSLVGLTPFRDYLPKEISGGMKQRVALARVLILKPAVLLMDEPFGALDAQTREEMQNLLLSLRTALNHTIVFVTHDVSEAVTLADRILVMGSMPGRIRHEIPVNLARPRTRESDAFHHHCKQLYELLRGEAARR